MGRIFDRIKFIIRYNIKNFVKKVSAAGDRVKDKIDSTNDWCDEKVDKIDEELQKIRERHRRPPSSLEKSYAVLGLEFNANMETVTKRWKELIKINHPDIFDLASRKQAEINSQKINEAYQNIKKYLDEKNR